MSDLDVREIASGLRFPEGPVAIPPDDEHPAGSVVLVELERGTLSRVDVATGTIDVIAECGGAPNAAALGPDGAFYVCNNGGFFEWHDTGTHLIPGGTPESWTGGSIQRVDPATGAITTLYEACDGRPLAAPNDLVFDDAGGFWFTDHGVRPHERSDRPGVLYAKADGSFITAAAFGTDATNGIGLSPAGDRLYVAETHTGRLWEWSVEAPGVLGPRPLDPEAAHDAAEVDESTARGGAHLLYDAPEGHLYDSLAVDGDGWVCIATIGQGGVTAVSPDGTAHEHHPLDDFIVTNICFSAHTPTGDLDGERRTAYVTCSATGRLVALTWPRPGLELAH